MPVTLDVGVRLDRSQIRRAVSQATRGIDFVPRMRFDIPRGEIANLRRNIEQQLGTISVDVRGNVVGTGGVPVGGLSPIGPATTGAL